MAAKDIEAGRAYVLLSIRNRLGAGLRAAEKSLSKFGSTAAMAGGAVAGGSAAAAIWPIKLAGDMERASISMEVFLGSADAAKKIIGDIETMAAKTPFQFDELKDSAQLLLSFGATGKQVLPMLQMLGDVSGGNSERFQRLSLAFGQVMAKGRLMGQEVMQMTEQGFNPLAEISKATGKSMKTLMNEMEEGKISFPMLVQAFQSATGEGGRFFNLMEKQSRTLFGMFSTLVDYTKIAVRAIGDQLLPVLKSIIAPAIDLAKGLATIAKANSGLISAVGKIVLVISGIAAAFAGLGSAALATSFVVGLMSSGLTAVGVVLGTLFSPFGILLGVFAGLAGAAIYFRGALAEAFQGLLIWIQPVVSAFERIFSVVVGAVGGIVDALSSGQIELAGTIALTALRAMFWQAAAEIPGAGIVLSTSFGQALLASRWDLIGEMAMARLQLVIAQAWASITNTWSAGTTGLGAIWDMLVYGIRTGWNQASIFLASGIMSVVGNFRLGIAGIITLFDALSVKAQQAANTIAGYFSGSMEQAAAQNTALQRELESRTAQRLSGIVEQNAGEQAAISQQRDQTQRGIQAEYEQSMADRVKAEQATRDANQAKIAALQQRLVDLQNEANQAASDAGITTAQDAANQAKADLDAAIAEAARLKEQQAQGKLPGTMVPGLKASASMAKIESQGTFSAAAAVAFGARVNAAEETAKNTALANRYLRKMADKPGLEFA